jgi:hypothetical protein
MNDVVRQEAERFHSSALVVATRLEAMFPEYECVSASPSRLRFERKDDRRYRFEARIKGQRLEVSAFWASSSITHKTYPPVVGGNGVVMATVHATRNDVKLKQDIDEKVIVPYEKGMSISIAKVAEAEAEHAAGETLVQDFCKKYGIEERINVGANVLRFHKWGVFEVVIDSGFKGAKLQTSHLPFDTIEKIIELLKECDRNAAGTQ